MMPIPTEAKQKQIAPTIQARPTQSLKTITPSLFQALDGRSGAALSGHFLEPQIRIAAPAASPITDGKDRSKLSNGNNNFENYNNVELLSSGRTFFV
jgi:hypothetical protein